MVGNLSRKVRIHYRKHKKVYLVGSYVVVAGAVFVVTRATIPSRGISNTAILVWRNKQMIKLVIRRGHPGYVVRCLETGEIFASIRRAAEANGISASTLRQHLAGKQDAVSGLHFEKLGEALAVAE